MNDTEKYQPARQNMKLVTGSFRSLATYSGSAGWYCRYQSIHIQIRYISRWSIFRFLFFILSTIPWFFLLMSFFSWPFYCVSFLQWRLHIFEDTKEVIIIRNKGQTTQWPNEKVQKDKQRSTINDKNDTMTVLEC